MWRLSCEETQCRKGRVYKMSRFKLIVEYDGRPFAGWQRQKDAMTVQEVLEGALSDFLQQSIVIQGSGRTDSGVHATHQVAHVDIEKSYSTDAIQGAVNRRLEQVPVSIVAVESVDDDFHARFSATYRAYKYVILARRARPTFEKGQVWWVPRELDHERMHEAAQHLIGHHDFTSFRDSMCQANSPMKTLEKLNVTRDGDRIIINTKSRSFLHRQVRNMVGTLKRVGDGSWEPEKVKEILEAKDRRVAGPTASPHGLYLCDIGF